MNSVLIDRQKTFDILSDYYHHITESQNNFQALWDALLKVPAASEWIPVVTIPMTGEERRYYEDDLGVTFEDEDAVLFNCEMPADGQRIWICTESGYVHEDVCENDGGFIGLEGNGDWLDVVAWMPLYVPEPYKGGINE